MDDLAGILILVGLAVLTVPLLLVMALVKIGNAKLRIDALERDVQRLQTRVLHVESSRPAPAVANPAEAQDSTSEVPLRASPAAAPPPPTRVDEFGLVVDAPITGRARFDVPEYPAQDAARPETASAPSMPPPLPFERAMPPAAAAATATETQAPPRPQRPPPPPPADPFAPIVDGVRRWFTEGNVPVKIGMLVLLAGVAALLKYASDQHWLVVPIELRLAGIAAAAIGGLVFAWRQRETRRSFSLSLQGGAIGVLMLVTFAAFKLYHLIPASAAFGITIALVAGLGVLAVLQNALALAVFGILAGFLAPIWLSTGSGNHVALFSYYAVLNLGIFGIAWAQSKGRGPWKSLNLLGFVFTFGIGTLWGVLQYKPEKFATTEPFLLLFFALYLLIPIFYARGRMARDRGDNAHALVDGTLVFGTPLVAFSLQAGLLHGGVFGDSRMPLALSALGAAAIYALLAAFLRGRERFSSLVDSYAVLAVGFSTLSVPLALSARATASVFALEGAALVWLGVRQDRRLPQFSGLLLQFGAALAFVLGIGGISSGFSPMGTMVDTPIANPAFMAALLIALAGFATAWTYRNTPDNGLVGMFTLWAFGWWTFAGLNEIGEYAPHRYRIDAMFAFMTLTAWIAAELRRRFDDMALLGGLAAMTLLLGVPFAMAQTAEHAYPFREWGAAAWVVYAALGWRALTCLREAGTGVRLVAHGGWFWSWVVALALAAFHLVYRSARNPADFDAASIVHQTMGDGWRMLALGLPVLVFAALLQLRPSLLAPPLSRGFEDYRRPLLASAWVVLAMFWLLSLFFPGDSAPLPWVSLLNPLELLQVAALALLAQRVWSNRGAQTSRIGVPMFALAAFVWITFATLRATHQWGHAPWSPTMLDDKIVQTTLTLVWSVLGVLGWIFGSKRGDRLLWGAGAVLMGVVLLKLLLIDRSHLGNLFGIVSFIAYGLLCTAVGYFAPAPPRRAASAEVSA
ncbi:MAG: DUF2339 domain-containing protein [Lysobacteraceae bacterium]